MCIFQYYYSDIVLEYDWYPVVTTSSDRRVSQDEEGTKSGSQEGRIAPSPVLPSLLIPPSQPEALVQPRFHPFLLSFTSSLSIP